MVIPLISLALALISLGLSCFGLGYNIASYQQTDFCVREKVAKRLQRELAERCACCQRNSDSKRAATDARNETTDTASAHFDS